MTLLQFAYVMIAISYLLAVVGLGRVDSYLIHRTVAAMVTMAR